MQLLPLLDSLRKTAFFRFFKVSLYKECPFWDDDGMCALEACSVCECDEHDVPLAWREGTHAAADDEAACVERHRARPLPLRRFARSRSYF